MRTISKIIHKNKKINNKGFTLVELLAVLALLSLVTTIVIFTSVSVIGNAKENSYKVTISNIEKHASSYVLEDGTSIKWLKYGENFEYQCVTVQNLIDKGYFKNDVLDSKISDTETVSSNNYIYLERDVSTKSITKNILLAGGKIGYTGLCSNVNPYGNISFYAVPGGWSKSKEVTIYYNLSDNIDIGEDVTQYYYGYEFIDSSEKVVDSLDDKPFDKKSVQKKITVSEKGIISAEIEVNGDTINNTIDISKIDTTGPEGEMDHDSYNGESVVRRKVSIPLKFTDSESGIDNNSISLMDMEAYIGDDKLNSGLSLNKISDDNYELEVENYFKSGLLKVKIPNSKILDNVDNGNESIEIDTGITFSNKYEISYDANGGTGNMESTECEYLGYCQVSENLFTKAGYTFVEWNTKADGSGTSYDSGYEFDEYRISEDITLYAKWRKNIVTIKYSVNSGDLATTSNSHGKWTLNENDIVLLNGNVARTLIKYGESTESTGVFNYNNKDFLNISKVGYTAIVHSEWMCMEGCIDLSRSYSQYKVYNASDFCDASHSDCEVTLGVDWIGVPIKIHYNVNGGRIATASNSKGKWSSDDSGFVLRSNPIIVSTSVATSGTSYGAAFMEETVVNGDSSLDELGLNNYNNSSWLNISRIGYIAKEGYEWNTNADGSGMSFSQDIQYTYDELLEYAVLQDDYYELNLYVNWDPLLYTLSIDPNGGSYNGSSSITKIKQEYASFKSLVDPTPPSGYTVTFDGKGGTSDSSSLTSSKTFTEWTKTSNTGVFVKASEPVSASGGLTYANTTCDGEPCTKFSYATYGTESDSWYMFRYPEYRYIPGNTYDIKFKLKIESFSGTKFGFRHSALSNDYGTSGLQISWIDENSVSSSWHDMSITRTFTGTQISFNGQLRDILPVFEGYTNTLIKTKNPYSSAVFYIKDLKIMNKSLDLLLQSNCNMFRYIGDGTLEANYRNGSITLPSASRAGYTFLGWYTSNGTKVGDAGASYVPTDDTTLYAQWQQTTYTISYDANGGSGTMTSHSCAVGGSCSTKTNAFTREGYQFLGWTTNSDGSDDEYYWTNWSGTWNYVNGQFGISNYQLKLYARWKKLDFKTTQTTNGNWNLWTSPGYTMGSNMTKVYIYNGDGTRTLYDESSQRTSFSNTIKAYSAGGLEPFNNSYSREVLVRGYTSADKTILYIHKDDFRSYLYDGRYVRFIRFWLTEDKIKKNATCGCMSSCGGKNSASTCLSFTTYNSTTYYGVWVSFGCTTNDGNCPLSGLPLEGLVAGATVEAY